jgi:hypothetical protein
MESDTFRSITTGFGNSQTLLQAVSDVLCGAVSRFAARNWREWQNVLGTPDLPSNDRPYPRQHRTSHSISPPVRRGSSGGAASFACRMEANAGLSSCRPTWPAGIFLPDGCRSPKRKGVPIDLRGSYTNHRRFRSSRRARMSANSHSKCFASQAGTPAPCSSATCPGDFGSPVPVG